MSKTQKRKAYYRGHIAEYYAVLMLVFKGYSIRKRRYRTPVGEIDIIAQKGDTTIFCEVKARKDYNQAVWSLSEVQKRRISRAAEFYMSRLKSRIKNNKIENNLYRCDMILIIPWHWPVHIENAW